MEENMVDVGEKEWIGVVAGVAPPLTSSHRLGTTRGGVQT